MCALTVRRQEREVGQRRRVGGCGSEELVLVDHLEEVEVRSGRRVAGKILGAALGEEFLELPVVALNGAGEVADIVVLRLRAACGRDRAAGRSDSVTLVGSSGVRLRGWRLRSWEQARLRTCRICRRRRYAGP